MIKNLYFLIVNSFMFVLVYFCCFGSNKDATIIHFSEYNNKYVI